MKVEDILEGALDIFESNTTHFDTINWTVSDGIFVGVGTIHDINIRILLEPATYLLNNRKRVWLNIAFEREIDGKWTQHLLGTHDKSRYVIGAIRNATIDKLIELNSLYQIDALAGIAVDGELKRLSLYTRFFSSPITGLPGWNRHHMRVKVPGGEAEVALSPALSQIEVDTLVASLRARGQIETDDEADK
jgi:hypothetical protein